MKKIIEAAEQVCELRLKFNSDTLSRNLCDVIDERKELEQRPITEEWLEEHGWHFDTITGYWVRHDCFYLLHIIDGNDWWIANTEMKLNNLADLYDTCELCEVELDK